LSKNKKRKSVSNLSDHRRKGKLLQTPFMDLLGATTQFQSWMDTRLPEALWLCLMFSQMERPQAFWALRDIGLIARELVGVTESRLSESLEAWNLTHSSMALMPAAYFNRILLAVFNRSGGKEALRPLLLLDTLPGRDAWRAVLDEPTEADWDTLRKSVADCLYHQSMATTDVRFALLFFRITTGEVKILDQGFLEKIWGYPEDPETFGPSIRAAEGGFSGLLKSSANWSEEFWRECREKTDCIAEDPQISVSHEATRQEILCDIVTQARSNLEKHWESTAPCSAIDARHDSSFGILFYSLDLIDEILCGTNCFSISGRLAVRTLVECHITLAYLVRSNDEKLWSRFRKYGQGQSKLALLKMQQSGPRSPQLISEDFLSLIVNEDLHQEYQDIDLGHWCSSDLRKMSEFSGTKEDYDQFYGLASSFVHCQWGAIRICAFTTCLNPLHRLHRIPSQKHPFMENISDSALFLLRKLLISLDSVYPGLEIPTGLKVYGL
jgi:hypothetical protein